MVCFWLVWGESWPQRRTLLFRKYIFLNKWEDTGWICLLYFAWERCFRDHSEKGLGVARAVKYWIRGEESVQEMSWVPICHFNLLINSLISFIWNQIAPPSEVKYAYYFYLYTMARSCSSYCITRWKIQLISLYQCLSPSACWSVAIKWPLTGMIGFKSCFPLHLHYECSKLRQIQLSLCQPNSHYFLQN